MIRNIRTLILVSLILVSTLQATAQGVIVHKSDGTKIDIPYTELDSITTYKGVIDSEQNNVDQEASITLGQDVDLGLPSGTIWAGWNVGASSPEECGGYYAWGETEEKSDYSWATYKYWTNTDGDSIAEDSEMINIGADIRGSQYDVASQKWGGSWRMPAYEEIEELVNKCTWTWITYKGINGFKVIGPNGNSIFLPAAGCRNGISLNSKGSGGYYWYGTLSIYSNCEAWLLLMRNGSHFLDGNSRFLGFTVRPVK